MRAMPKLRYILPRGFTCFGCERARRRRTKPAIVFAAIEIGLRNSKLTAAIFAEAAKSSRVSSISRAIACLLRFIGKNDHSRIREQAA